MKTSSEKKWLIVMIAFAVAAGASLVVAIFSALSHSMIKTVASIAMFALFVVCLATANIVRTKMSELKNEKEMVSCMKLKRPGIEYSDEDDISPKSPFSENIYATDDGNEGMIVPKGKFPKGKMPKG
jgi:hypothetical protein